MMMALYFGITSRVLLNGSFTRHLPAGFGLIMFLVM